MVEMVMKNSQKKALGGVRMEVVEVACHVCERGKAVGVEVRIPKAH